MFTRTSLDEEHAVIKKRILPYEVRTYNGRADGIVSGQKLLEQPEFTLSLKIEVRGFARLADTPEDDAVVVASVAAATYASQKVERMLPGVLSDHFPTDEATPRLMEIGRATRSTVTVVLNVELTDLFVEDNTQLHDEVKVLICGITESTLEQLFKYAGL